MLALGSISTRDAELAYRPGGPGETAHIYCPVPFSLQPSKPQSGHPDSTVRLTTLNRTTISRH